MQSLSLYLLGMPLLNNNFFLVLLHCYRHANFNDHQQLTFVTLLTPPGALSSLQWF